MVPHQWVTDLFSRDPKMLSNKAALQISLLDPPPERLPDRLHYLSPDSQPSLLGALNRLGISLFHCPEEGGWTGAPSLARQ